MERIFKWFTKESGDPRSTAYTYWFTRYFEPKDFDGVDRMLMCYLKYCSKLSITPCKEYLTAYLKVDGKSDVKKYNVRTDTLVSLDYRESSQLEEAFQIISGATQATFDTYLQEDLNDRDFKVDVYDFMSNRRSDRIQQIMMDAYPKLTDGSNVSDVSMELRSSLAELDKIYDTDKIKSLELAEDEEEDEGEMHFLAKTGMPCIDGDIGGIYTKIMVTLNAQPGGGKTRFGLIHYAYQVMTEAKKDVLLYELELTKMQVKNILIAYHITRVYGGRIKIPDSVMNKKREMTDEQKQIYESAKIDLFESGKYGNLIIREEAIVEKLEDEIEAVISTSGNLGYVIIDYMGLLQSEPATKYDKRKELFEVITDGYIATRHILKKYDVGALCINQFNDKGIDAAYAGKQIRSGHVQGGHIVQRHTDYDLSMTYTEEQQLANVRMLATSKTRGTKGFQRVMLSTDLSVSIFRQELTK